LVAQNTIELLGLFTEYLPISELMKTLPYESAIKEAKELLGLSLYEGTLRVVTDRDVLSKLDMSTLTKPGIWKIEDAPEVWDDLHVKKLDRFRLDQILFLEAHTGENEDEVNIIPIHI
jgi:hypothetical protein